MSTLGRKQVYGFALCVHWEHRPWCQHCFLCNRYQDNYVPCVVPDMQMGKCKFWVVDQEQRDKKKPWLFPIRLTHGEVTGRWNSWGAQVGPDTIAFKRNSLKAIHLRVRTFLEWWMSMSVQHYIKSRHKMWISE